MSRAKILLQKTSERVSGYQTGSYYLGTLKAGVFAIDDTAYVSEEDARKNMKKSQKIFYCDLNPVGAPGVLFSLVGNQ